MGHRAGFFIHSSNCTTRGLWQGGRSDDCLCDSMNRLTDTEPGEKALIAEGGKSVAMELSTVRLYDQKVLR